jgi:hypothetical protein
MANDHYVAETYLKHFAGVGGMLHGYGKRSGKSFRCWPGDVCAELDGDYIPDFLSNAGFLGEYRKAFEPAWNEAVSSIAQRALDRYVKFHIAGYWANLLVCTPTWRRFGVEFYNQSALHHLEERVANDRSDPMLVAGLNALKRGKIRLDTEPDFIRAKNVINVLKYAWVLYNADRRVFENDSDVEFITSDNPASFEDQGDWRGGRLPFLRFLPLTPRLCLMCDLSAGAEQAREETPDFTRAPRGKIRGGVATALAIDKINTATAKCAEGLLLEHFVIIRDCILRV